ncbi:MAG: LysE family transporter, partial [Spirochaetes bacterium]|nr:LysE family transporter [Spirochaetota bacterium]
MFVSASALLAIAPGPDNLFVLAQSVVHGRLAGMAIIMGLCTGLVVHTSAVALGLAVIFKTSAVAFNIVKYCGVA